RLHNGTVYRWNRPCYGVADGKAHLRIENRVLPAGPTVVDEVANAAFFYGLMAAVTDAYGDITRALDFDDAKANFVAAARQGLQAQFHWTGGRTVTASELILKELLPIARQGLLQRNLDADDVDRYLGVIEGRVASERTGARWALDSMARMPNRVTKDERMRALVTATLAQQATSQPVHTWPLADFAEQQDWRHSYERVGQFMTDDVYTVRPDDLVDLAANLMDWVHVRHIPVEDDDGRLVGMVTHRRLLRLLSDREGAADEPVAVRDIMDTDPVTVTPDTPTVEAIALMRAPDVKCLPVCDQGQLVGIITERDIFDLATRLLERELREFRKPT
ncbi:MAG: CBS domain-containing protein, partial [Myxococcales bacterium]|nr:CBS domain-containing protein [Myxococcales bacterium]